MPGILMIKSEISISDAVARSISLFNLVRREDSQPIPVAGSKSPEGLSSVFAGFISSTGSFAGSTGVEFSTGIASSTGSLIASSVRGSAKIAFTSSGVTSADFS